MVWLWLDIFTCIGLPRQLIVLCAYESMTTAAPQSTGLYIYIPTSYRLLCRPIMTAAHVDLTDDHDRQILNCHGFETLTPS